MKKAVIYTITNKVNGRKYVGSTFYFRSRKESHFRQLKNKVHPNSKLQNAYNKYGKQNLIMEEVECVLDRKDLLQVEQRYLNTGEYIYNISNIAGSPMTGRKHTAHTKLKISQNNARHNKGKPQSVQAKLKNVKNNCSGWIICVETGQKFLGIGEAAREMGLWRGNIGNVINGRLKTTGGFTFIKKEIVEI